MKKRGKNKNRIQLKMFKYCLILIMIPLVVIGFSSYRMYSNVVETKIERYERVILRQIQDNIEGKLSNIRTTARSVTINTDILELFREYRYMKRDSSIELSRTCLNTLRSCMYTNDSIRSILICSERQEMSVGNIGENSMEYAKTRQIIDDFQANKDRDWYLVDQEEAYVDQMLTYVTELRDYYKGNDAIGVIAINVNDVLFRGLFENMEKVDGSYYFLSDSGKYVFGTDPEAGDLLQIEDVREMSGEKYICVDFLGEQYAVFCQPVKGNDWKIYSAIPLANYLSDIIVLRGTTMVIGIVSVLTAIALSILFSRKLTRPINNLVKEMSRVQQGNLEISADNVYEDDEIGYLKNRFDEMLCNVQKLIEQIHEHEVQKRKAELNALQAQINPHFLYNTLNSINCLAQMENQKEISEIIVELGDLLRASIGSQNEFITIGDEIDYIEKYMKINNIRYNGRFLLNVDLPEDLSRFYLPKMLLQPLVENSLLHGFEGITSDCRIDVTIQAEGEDISITVADNGLGIPPDTLDDINTKLENLAKSDEQIGIYNVNARLKLHFGADYGLRFIAKEQGTTVRILMPKNSMLQVVEE